jgi:hypothetical protein
MKQKLKTTKSIWLQGNRVVMLTTEALVFPDCVAKRRVFFFFGGGGMRHLHPKHKEGTADLPHSAVIEKNLRCTFEWGEGGGDH